MGGITPPLRETLNFVEINTEPMLRVKYAADDAGDFGTDRRGVERLSRTFVEAL